MSYRQSCQLLPDVKTSALRERESLDSEVVPEGMESRSSTEALARVSNCSFSHLGSGDLAQQENT
jgi:hypothetical protein